MFFRKLTLARVIKFIQQADDYQVNEIINTLQDRYRKVYPDWEVVFLSLPKNSPEERKNIIDYFLKFENMT